MKSKSGVTESSPLLFVYGTLMKGFHEEWQRRVGGEFVGRGTIRASLYDFGDYPGAKVLGDKSRRRVSGELYRLRDTKLALRTLDKYEEYFPLDHKKSLFIRMLVPVTLEDGRKRSAWAYIYKRAVANSRLIPSGRYRDSATSRHAPLAVGSEVR